MEGLMMDTKQPTSGSPDAVKLGCTCPVYDNCHGRGLYGGAVYGSDGRPLYCKDADCPIHGMRKTKFGFPRPRRQDTPDGVRR